MTALWLAVVTALGSQGIPKIVEMLDNKPDTEQVQTMIATQTEALTKAQHQAVEKSIDHETRVLRLERVLSKQRARVSRLEGLVELLQDVMRDCCTRKQLRNRLAKPTVLAKPAVNAQEEEDEVPAVKSLKLRPAPCDDPIKVIRVPDFKMPQQLQQVPAE